jgi:hypothetical protein
MARGLFRLDMRNALPLPRQYATTLCASGGQRSGKNTESMRFNNKKARPVKPLEQEKQEKHERFRKQELS